MPSGAPQEHPLPDAPTPSVEAEVPVAVGYTVRGDGTLRMDWRIDASRALPAVPPRPLFSCAYFTSCSPCVSVDESGNTVLDVGACLHGPNVMFAATSPLMMMIDKGGTVQGILWCQNLTHCLMQVASAHWHAPGRTCAVQQGALVRTGPPRVLPGP